MTTPSTAASAQTQDDEILDVERTSCCIVGGPGGAMLALLLARRGVPATVGFSRP